MRFHILYDISHCDKVFDLFKGKEMWTGVQPDLPHELYLMEDIGIYLVQGRQYLNGSSVVILRHCYKIS